MVALRRHDSRSHPLTFVRKGTKWCLRRACALSDQDDFVRQLRKFARKANTVVVVDKTKGKGSHARVKYGARVTTVPRKIGPGLRRAILKQLGIDPREFDTA